LEQINTSYIIYYTRRKWTQALSTTTQNDQHSEMFADTPPHVLDGSRFKSVGRNLMSQSKKEKGVSMHVSTGWCAHMCLPGHT